MSHLTNGKQIGVPGKENEYGHTSQMFTCRNSKCSNSHLLAGSGFATSLISANLLEAILSAFADLCISFFEFYSCASKSVSAQCFIIYFSRI